MPSEPKSGTGSAASGAVDLTVLFVTRNEEDGIRVCIESTMRAVKEAQGAGLLSSVEYVLVDSASTDRTVAIASGYPIQIVALSPSWPLSCGAGCYVGLMDARGTWTAIINADMVINRRWFVDVFPYLGLGVGAVCGIATEDLGDRTAAERMVCRHSTMSLSLGKLPPMVTEHPGGYSAGTFIVRTEAAKRVGSYNPFFRAAEDMDLRYRLMHAGWAVLNVPVHQGLHRWSKGDRPLDLAAYLATILRNSIGLGQMARFNSSRDDRVAHKAAQQCVNARTAMNALIGSSVISLALANTAIALLVTIPWAPVLAIGDIAIGGVVAQRARKKRLPVGDYLFSEVFVPPAFALIRLLGFAWGFTKRPQGPDQYPRGARIVKRSPEPSEPPHSTAQ